MKRNNIELVKKIVDKIEKLEKRIEFLQQPKIDAGSDYIIYKGRHSGGYWIEFSVSLGHMRAYILSQTIQAFQAEKAELEAL